MSSEFVVRDAAVSDIPEMVAMGREFLLSGPYKDVIEDNPEAATRLAHDLIEKYPAKVLVSESGNHLTGIVAFIVYPHFYSGNLVAQELIWFVRKEARRSFTPICLFRAAERKARELGAHDMQFTAPTEDVAKFYQACGYHQIEIGFQRSLIGKQCPPFQQDSH